MEAKNCIILSDSETHQIVKFKECGHIGLMYKNLLLSFHPEGFEQFLKIFSGMQFDRHATVFTDGTERLIVNTSFQQIQFSFGRSEFEQLKKAFIEASLMLEITNLMN